jgi:acetolactate synthase-1/2/3 large subunit
VVDADLPMNGGVSLDDALWSDLFDQLKQARRPLLWVGGGVRAARATAALRKFLERVPIPVVNSMMAVDALPSSEPLRVGFIGTYGNRWANLAVGESDLILVLGARLDIRQTGSDPESLSRGRTIFQVDCEPGEINNRVKGCHAIHADISQFLARAFEAAATRDFAEPTAWLAEIDDLRRRYPDTEEVVDRPGINPNVFMHQLSDASQEAAAYVVDVGQHQVWASQSLQLAAGQSFLTSGGLGSMGFALPAAIAAGLLAAPRPVVVVAGDGGFQCNIQELESVARNGLPLKIVIMNNACHGMTRQFQESFFGERYQSSLWGYSAPDFARVAAAYGIDAHSVQDEADAESAIEWLWRNPAAPALLQVMVNTYVNAYPKVAFGRPITDMEPFVKPLPEWSAPPA